MPEIPTFTRAETVLMMLAAIHSAGAAMESAAQWFVDHPDWAPDDDGPEAEAFEAANEYIKAALRMYAKDIGEAANSTAVHEGESHE